MTNDKMYGVCENKSFVETISKEQFIDEQNRVNTQFIDEQNRVNGELLNRYVKAEVDEMLKSISYEDQDGKGR